MSAITPDSDIYLLKSPIELDNANQLTFANKTAQFNYFNSLPKISMEDSTYQRKDSVIRFEANIDSILEYNYVMYRNNNYGDKWFYAYVVNMEWLNDRVTAITIKTDVYQTWQFDLNFKQSFVLREHVNDDTVGKHTIPEGLETGEFICNDIDIIDLAKPNDNTTMICIQVSKIELTKDNMTYKALNLQSGNLGVYTGLPQGCYIIALPMLADNIGQLKTITGLYDVYGAGDAIVSIFLVPKACSDWTQTTDSLGNTVWYPSDRWSAKTLLAPVYSSPTTLNGYTPRNNKLFIADYNYLYCSNYAGSDIVFRYEDYRSNTPAFTIQGSIEQGGAIMLYPQNSLKSTDGWSEGVNGGKLPTLSWVSDYYLNWQAYNNKNLEIQTTIGAINYGLGMGAELTSFNPAGMAELTKDYVGEIANSLQQVRVAQMTPPQAKGNTNTGSIAFSAGRVGFIFRKMSVRAEYAKSIDDYFTMYGYKVNSKKVPNITGRRNWNYVKTAGCNIEAYIPQDDLQEIKGMFNQGITLWHNSNTFLDYSQSNPIV